LAARPSPGFDRAVLAEPEEMPQPLQIPLRRDRGIGPGCAESSHGIHVQILQQPAAVGFAPWEETLFEDVLLPGDRRSGEAPSETNRPFESAYLPIVGTTSVPETVFTVAEVAERLKVNEETVRRLFVDEPGVIVISFPRKGKRLYRTVRIPEDVLRRVLTRVSR
jgi:hypothetical protein